jgi:hypothetical protein
MEITADATILLHLVSVNSRAVRRSRTTGAGVGAGAGVGKLRQKLRQTKL